MTENARINVMRNDALIQIGLEELDGVYNGDLVRYGIRKLESMITILGTAPSVNDSLLDDDVVYLIIESELVTVVKTRLEEEGKTGDEELYEVLYEIQQGVLNGEKKRLKGKVTGRDLLLEDLTVWDTLVTIPLREGLSIVEATFLVVESEDYVSFNEEDEVSEPIKGEGGD